MAKYNYNPSTDHDNAYHMVDFKDYEYEPQRGNNFEVQITGLSDLVSVDKSQKIINATDTIRLACAGSGTPGFSVETLKVQRGNAEVKFAGKASYDDSEIKLNDFIGKDTEKVISAWQGLVYNPKTQNIGKASQYKKTGYLMEYSPDHAIVRQWQLVGCWVSKVAYGDYASDNASLRQITATLVYDYAIPLDD